MPQYRAKKALFLGRHRAHNAGDLVPAKNVKKHGWEADVEVVGAEELFDPGKHSVPEVLDYLESADEVEQARVLEAEKAGKARASLIG